MNTLPDDVTAYKRTPEFNENSIPAGLLKAHLTKSRVWGRIVILDGELLYRILEPAVEEVRLSVEQFGVVEPEVLHEVQVVGPVRFYVEFLQSAVSRFP